METLKVIVTHLQKRNEMVQHVASLKSVTFSLLFAACWHQWSDLNYNIFKILKKKIKKSEVFIATPKQSILYSNKPAAAFLAKRKKGKQNITAEKLDNKIKTDNTEVLQDQSSS